ncbi:TadA family conjugal transfer-associated ATPase [Microbacterium amylolyticum]|uniref:Pilus assembly protein CpaF n=1 Tax=Microbacterium amylolyticum TaxID=936337 RepID=A0ABS4ZKD0_9MICO|nr:TadA family conjugal transfer-associated ATPase [Microbacterium amylolyticum]MBP2437478.1 pilus assembly protein CpaF [Microbacterium amylolyticum]
MTEPFVVQPRNPSGTQPVAATSDEARPLDSGTFGALAPYVADADVTDLFVNGSSGLFVDRGAGAERVTTWRASEREVRDLATALVGRGGRHVDDQTPLVDVRLAGGVRVHVALAPVATGGTAISVRVPRLGRVDIDGLRRGGAFTESAAAWLGRLVARRANVLVTGGAGCGKTTLLSALLAGAPPTERIVTIEDVAELRLEHPHHVALEARQANREGAGEIPLARLVRESLRMRPDRIVVGECRGEEIRDLLTALNTGHDGGAGTLHANSIADVPARLEALGALAGWDDHAVARQASSAIDVVLHLERTADGTRRLAAAGALRIDNGRLAIEEVTPWE